MIGPYGAASPDEMQPHVIKRTLHLYASLHGWSQSNQMCVLCLVVLGVLGCSRSKGVFVVGAAVGGFIDGTAACSVIEWIGWAS